MRPYASIDAVKSELWTNLYHCNFIEEAETLLHENGKLMVCKTLLPNLE